MNNQLNYQGSQRGIDEIDPDKAYEKLVGCSSSFLVDVRSQAEWSFVGIPCSLGMTNEVIFCEWASFPEMRRNPEFLESFLKKINLKKAKSIYFLCRSGARSLQAALEVDNYIQHSQNEFDNIICVNIRCGFEGDLSEDLKRGMLNGWKYSNLPWKQV